MLSMMWEKFLGDARHCRLITCISVPSSFSHGVCDECDRQVGVYISVIATPGESHKSNVFSRDLSDVRPSCSLHKLFLRK